MALLRDQPRSAELGQGLEVLLVTRPASSAFAPRAEVFPGGAVDPTDLDPEWSELASRLAFSAEVERHLLTTAVRETFEECGVLLARDALGRPCRPELVAELEELRRLVQAGHPERFLPGLKEAGLRPGWEDLAFCAHWVTPEGLPRIFDTRFFLAALPSGQMPGREPAGELTGTRWVRPQAALDEALQGRVVLLPPTRAVLEQLASRPTVSSALRFARTARKVRIQPKLSEITSARYPGLDVQAVLGPRAPGEG